MQILALIFKFFANIAVARNIKRDSEQRKKCKLFGITSIVCSILCVPFAVLTYFCLQWLSGEGILLLIFILPLMIVAGICTLIMAFNAIGYWILQIYVNFRPVTWIALIFMVAGIGFSVLIVLYTFGAAGISFA